MKFNYVIILVSIISLLVLYTISLLSDPEFISFSALSSHSGQQVRVQGIVIEYRTTSYNTQLITLRDNENESSTVLLYIDGSTPVECGDIIQAVGQVQRYNNQWEIMVSNPQFIHIVKKWGTSAFPLWQIAEHPQRYLDTNVNITGVIRQTQQAGFVLSDPLDIYHLDVVCDATAFASFSTGDPVAVSGGFLYDPTSFRFFLKLSSNDHRIVLIEDDTCD
jgi:hypothetical protein